MESNDSIDDIIVMSLLHPPYNEVGMLDMNIRFNNTNGGFSMRLLLPNGPNMRGCIDGIICIGGSSGDSFEGFFLWNPAIRLYKVVPYPTLHAPLLSTPISSTLMSTMHLVIITILMTAKLLELSLIRDMRTTQW